jgi:hypothetical protein
LIRKAKQSNLLIFTSLTFNFIAMNKILMPVFISLLTATFFSCNEKEPDSDPSIAVPLQIKDSAATAVTSTPGLVPADSTQLVQPTVNAPVQTAGMNPAHGEPGHRCDIAVGAPLNSPVAKTTGSPTTTTTTVTPTAVTPAATTKTAPGMNPAHGQPGHRCDIAVGAPLNSPAAKPAEQPVMVTPADKPTASPASAPVAVPVQAPAANAVPAEIKKEN